MEEIEIVELPARTEAILREAAAAETIRTPETSATARADVLVLHGYLTRRGYLTYAITDAGRAYVAARHEE